MSKKKVNPLKIFFYIIVAFFALCVILGILLVRYVGQGNRKANIILPAEDAFFSEIKELDNSIQNISYSTIENNSAGYLIFSFDVHIDGWDVYEVDFDGQDLQYNVSERGKELIIQMEEILDSYMQKVIDYKHYSDYQKYKVDGIGNSSILEMETELSPEYMAEIEDYFELRDEEKKDIFYSFSTGRHINIYIYFDMENAIHSYCAIDKKYEFY